LKSIGRRDQQRSDADGIVPRQLAGIAELIENAAGQVRLDMGRAEETRSYLRQEPGLRIEDGVDLVVSKAGDNPEVEIVYDGECDGSGQCNQIVTAALERATGKKYTGTFVCRKTSHAFCRL